ncbi:MAG TPA: sigma-70 family RNA polymerase sigma factor [Nannocystis exedens]|nr:sigma-70 family RNA polymerase sigma factor [Nannocystis exedens]
MTTVPDDATLVGLAAKRGIEGQLAFEKLVDRHQQWLVRLLMHFLNSQSDAEDVAQEAFIRAFLAIESCGDGSRFRGWLRVLARRLAFNYRRDAKTRARYEERSGVLTARSTAPISGQVEGRDLLKQVLAELAYPYREIMVLRFVEELSLKEIAKILEIGESAAKMRLSRARTEFQRVYRRKGGGQSGHGRA